MFSHSALCMGTGFLFQIEDETAEDQLLNLTQGAVEILEDANQRFSLYIEDSEISQLLRGELDWAKASHQQVQIQKDVESWRERTGGFFDARVGSADYDPSGLVKSWATQNAANYLLANGVRKFTINAGGDIFMSPELQSRVLCRVGLSNLRSVAAEGAGANMVLDLYRTPYRAVATSGISERGEHIWRSDEDSRLIQVSVVGPELIEADIWATAIIAGGLAAWDLFVKSQSNRMTAIATDRTGAIFSSPGFVSLLATL